jgi:hypothetical protein
MKSLNILVIIPAFDKSFASADKETLRQISLVSPGINVIDASSQMAAKFQGDN